MGYWTPTPLFAGQTVFILGGGPSLASTDLEAVDPARSIAVNVAGELLPRTAVLFSRCATWCEGNVDLLRGWPGLAVVTRARLAAKAPNVKIVAMERRDTFPAPGHHAIRYGRSSGHAAVSLAVAMGARRIVLLGFDCRPVDGRTNWHDRYAEARLAIYPEFARAWRGWHAAARRVGVEIVNATPGSATDEFPIVELRRTYKAGVMSGDIAGDVLPEGAWLRDCNNMTKVERASVS